nr:AAA family ATPase [Natrinema sp. SYSU A 869]
MGNDPIPTPSVEDLQDDPMADEATSIFRRRELLRPQHVPQKDRIVSRDREIETVEALLKPAAFGDPPESGFLFGKTGTGKSLVAKHVTGRARGIAQMQGTDLTAAYVDCDQYNTETRAARTMAFEVRDAIEPDRYIPKEGVGASRYYDALWNSDGLLHETDSLIVILDEIDKLGDDTAEILSKLSRSEEAGKTGCYISVIAISNKTDYFGSSDERVASSFQDDPIIFPPYDANQLQALSSYSIPTYSSVSEPATAFPVKSEIVTAYEKFAEAAELSLLVEQSPLYQIQYGDFTADTVTSSPSRIAVSLI